MKFAIMLHQAGQEEEIATFIKYCVDYIQKHKFTLQEAINAHGGWVGVLEGS